MMSEEMLNEEFFDEDDFNEGTEYDDVEVEIVKRKHKKKKHKHGAPKKELLLYKLEAAEKENLLKLYGDKFDISELEPSFMAIDDIRCDAVVFNPYVLTEEERELYADLFKYDKGTLYLASAKQDKDVPSDMGMVYADFNIATADKVVALENKLTEDERLKIAKYNIKFLSTCIKDYIKDIYSELVDLDDKEEIIRKYDLRSEIFWIVLDKLTEQSLMDSIEESYADYARFCEYVENYKCSTDK